MGHVDELRLPYRVETRIDEAMCSESLRTPGSPRPAAAALPGFQELRVGDAVVLGEELVELLALEPENPSE